MSASSGGGGGGGGEESAKSSVVEHISQTVQSTSNILQLMLQSSPSHLQLMKLPKELLAKTYTIKNTELVLKQMPQVISSLDEHVESGLHSVPHLRTVEQLLSNMRSNQLMKPLSIAQLTQQEREPSEQHSQSN